jgi:protein O-GlcNAc transferase
MSTCAEDGVWRWCSARAHVLGQLQASGVDASRVDLLPLAAANSDHLATYALMDISLDPFPYAGTTTTCESLYMGVPVISLAGTPPASPPVFASSL